MFERGVGLFGLVLTELQLRLGQTDGQGFSGIVFMGEAQVVIAALYGALFLGCPGRAEIIEHGQAAVRGAFPEGPLGGAPITLHHRQHPLGEGFFRAPVIAELCPAPVFLGQMQQAAKQ